MNLFQQWVEKLVLVSVKPEPVARAPNTAPKAPPAPIPHSPAAPPAPAAQIQGEKELTMSKLSQVINSVVSFFENNKQVSTAAAPAVAGLTSALSATEEALPQIAEAGANAALALLGPVGTAFAPLADSYIEELITVLESKKSTSPAT